MLATQEHCALTNTTYTKLLQLSGRSSQTLIQLLTYEDFLNVYRKPMMSSLADLQSMIQMQVCYASNKSHLSLCRL